MVVLANPIEGAPAGYEHSHPKLNPDRARGLINTADHPQMTMKMGGLDSTDMCTTGEDRLGFYRISRKM